MEHSALLPVVAGERVIVLVATVLVPTSHVGVEESVPRMVNVTVPVGISVLCVTVAVKTMGSPV